MTNQNNELVALKSQLINQWQVDGDAFERIDLSKETLVGVLAMRVLYLMQEKMQTLITALYRMDVGEHQFDLAMQAETQPKAAKKIAEAIYARELQRVQSRMRFEKKQLNNNDSDNDGQGSEWPQVIS